MSEIPIEQQHIGGSAFYGNTIQATRPINRLDTQNYLKVVSLKEFCEKNFITRDVGYTLIKKKLIIAFRRHQEYWVATDPECKERLLEYLGIEILPFEIEQ